jgi:hypothetical protein
MFTYTNLDPIKVMCDNYKCDYDYLKSLLKKTNSKIFVSSLSDFLNETEGLSNLNISVSSSGSTIVSNSLHSSNYNNQRALKEQIRIYFKPENISPVVIGNPNGNHESFKISYRNGMIFINDSNGYVTKHDKFYEPYIKKI